MKLKTFTFWRRQITSCSNSMPAKKKSVNVDSKCQKLTEFIPKAVEELKKYTDVYYIEINDMVLPAQTMPCLYMFKNNEKATLRVGNAPIDIVRKDFERFFKQI